MAVAAACRAHNKVRRTAAIQAALGYNAGGSSALSVALGSSNAVLRDYRGRAVDRDGQALGGLNLGGMGMGMGMGMLDEPSGPQDADAGGMYDTLQGGRRVKGGGKQGGIGGIGIGRDGKGRGGRGIGRDEPVEVLQDSAMDDIVDVDDDDDEILPEY